MYLPCINSNDHGKATPDSALALDVLVRLVRGEFPQERSLVEIAEVWGDATTPELEALRSVEAWLGER
jgi:hypothetical protein